MLGGRRERWGTNPLSGSLRFASCRAHGRPTSTTCLSRPVPRLSHACPLCFLFVSTFQFRPECGAEVRFCNLLCALGLFCILCF